MNRLENKISGAEAVIRSLIEENVDLIYGYPGGAIMPIYDELFKFQDQINHVLTRHEQGLDMNKVLHMQHKVFQEFQEK